MWDVVIVQELGVHVAALDNSAVERVCGLGLEQLVVAGAGETGQAAGGVLRLVWERAGATEVHILDDTAVQSTGLHCGQTVGRVACAPGCGVAGL